ncbi:hypothetical protein ACR6C2_22280 [Streptomyces sp. INA 01156]
MPAAALAGYLRAQATEFLRALRLHGEAGRARRPRRVPPRRRSRCAVRPAGSAAACTPSRRSWTRLVRGDAPELAWVSGTLALEHACSARLERLLLALHRLSGTAFPAQADAGSRTGTARSAAPAPPPPGRARVPVRVRRPPPVPPSRRPPPRCPNAASSPWVPRRPVPCWTGSSPWPGPGALHGAAGPRFLPFPRGRRQGRRAGQ